MFFLDYRSCLLMIPERVDACGPKSMKDTALEWPASVLIYTRPAFYIALIVVALFVALMNLPA